MPTRMSVLRAEMYLPDLPGVRPPRIASNPPAPFHIPFPLVPMKERYILQQPHVVWQYIVIELPTITSLSP